MQTNHLSMMGGGGQGGSAKPQEEREALDRGNARRQDSPAGAGGTDRSEDTGREGSVGGTSNDDRSDDERSADLGRS